MSMEKEDCQIDAVHALQHVIEIVLKYLDRRDLISVSGVCKSWRDAVLREQSKRCHIQLLGLPYANGNIGSLKNKLQMEPYLSLWFFDSAFEQHLYRRGEKYNKLRYNLLEEIKKKKLPNKTILLRESACFITCGSDNGGTQEQRNQLRPDCEYHDTILGLFLPNAPQRLTVRTACMWWEDEPKFWGCIPRLGGAYHNVVSGDWSSWIVPCAANRVAKELGLDDCEYPKSTLIFLGFMGPQAWPCMFELCKREQQNGKEVTLASYLAQDILEADNCPTKNHERNSLLAWCRRLLRSKKQKKETEERSFFGMVLRISGPSVESWSTFIFLFATSDEIERKLHQLKEKVKYKRYCTGLFFAPECPFCIEHTTHPCGDGQEMMERVKRIFPDIPFVGSFQAYKHVLFEVHEGIPEDEFDENDVTKSN